MPTSLFNGITASKLVNAAPLSTPRFRGQDVNRPQESSQGDTVSFTTNLKGATPNDRFIIDMASGYLKAIQDKKAVYTSLEDQDPDYNRRVLKVSINNQPMLYDFDKESNIGFSSGLSHDIKILTSEDGKTALTWKQERHYSPWRNTEKITVQWQDNENEVHFESLHPKVLESVKNLFDALEQLYTDSQNNPAQ